MAETAGKRIQRGEKMKMANLTERITTEQRENSAKLANLGRNAKNGKDANESLLIIQKNKSDGVQT